MKNIKNSEFLRSIVIVLSFVFSVASCTDSTKTYRKVISEDYFNLYEDSLKKEGIESSSQIVIEKSYINVNKAVTFDVPLVQKRGYSPTCDNVKVTYDDAEIIFLDGPRVLLVWYNHDILNFNVFLNKNGKSIYSKQDFLKIKDMYENNKSDFSAIDRAYVELEW